MRRETFALLAIACFFGCDSKEGGALAAGCIVNSDCNPTLACVLGRCHAQCNADRDCSLGQRCLVTGGNGVCQLPGDQAPEGGPDGATEVDATMPVDATAEVDDAMTLDAIAESLADGSRSEQADAGPLFTNVLDRFDRADGPLNSGGVTQWIDEDHMGLMQYNVASRQLSGTLATGLPIWWDALYGGSAAVTEAFITIKSLSSDVTDFSLLIGAQTLSFCDFVRVLYEVQKGTVSAVSCQDGVGVVYGAPVPVGILANARLGARFETPEGRLTIYVDDAALGSWIIDKWRYVGRAGRIGLWLHRQEGGTRGPDTFDDFGGR